MANIKNKDINDLSSWNLKELRKLKIMLKNRIEGLEISSKKEVAKSHPLYKKDTNECQEILTKVLKAQKDLTK